jgi:hypothetical protein
MNIYEFLGFMRDNPGRDVKTKILSHMRQYSLEVIFIYYPDCDQFLLRWSKNKIMVVLDRKTIRQEHERDIFYVDESLYSEEAILQENNILNLSIVNKQSFG